MNDNHISIVISTRNASDFIEKSLDSAISQDYQNYSIIFLDAQSTDDTFQKAKKYEDKFEDIKILRNDKRKYQGENIRIGTEMSRPNSIIVTLDGDDWLPHEKVLSRVNKEYVDHDCWMTYGLYEEYPYRNISKHYFEFPDYIKKVNGFRKYKWLATHLRTFRRELFLKIKKEDLINPETNDFFENACDASFQFPMLEMCGMTKSRFIPDVLYVYNKENEESDYLKDQGVVKRIMNYICSQNPYPALTSL